MLGALKLASHQFSARPATATPPRGTGEPPFSNINLIHPGVLVRHIFMEEKCLSEKGLVHLAGIHPITLRRVITGEQPITHNIGYALDAALGITPGFFMRLQHQYNQRMENYRNTMTPFTGPGRGAKQSPFLTP